MAVMRFAIPKGGGPRSMAGWKIYFFDRHAVSRAIGKKQATALGRFGGYLRRVAQTSMRYRKGASPPGQPPSAHKDKRLAGLKRQKRARHNGALLREFLFYAYDPAARSVVVGPQGFRTRGGATPVPALHEYGGTRAAYKGETITVRNPVGRDPRTGRFFSKGFHTVPVTGTVRYPKRPTMGPALQATKAKFADQFRSLLTR